MSPPDIFISYASEDRHQAERLAAALQRQGWTVWWDRQILAGRNFYEAIETALDQSRCVLVLWSIASRSSGWVRDEADEAKRQNKLVPVLIEGVAIPMGFRHIQTADLAAWSGDERPGVAEADAGFQRLLRSIAALIGPPPSAPVAPAKEERRRHEAERGAREPVASASPPSASPSPWPLHLIRATSCLLLREGNRWAQQRTTVEVQGYEEELAPGVALTMVRIPAGTFLMGSPEGEEGRFDDEGPQHQVKVREFFLGQTSITQAQWKVVAGWEKVQLDLNTDPANFKGPNRPVEKVIWYEAVEFCRRLSRRTGKCYGLPSEAQWEYACRAGTTTPFHFGETLTAELANYDASSIYGDGPEGTYRKQTTDVGTFPANAWGLHDMHGNVWEWCEDHWHDTYEFAPEDDHPWLIPAAGNDVNRLLRGGSWYFSPGYCRSASRYCVPPDVLYSHVGFRVCSLPPGPS